MKRLLLHVTTFPKVSETFISQKFIDLHKRGLDVHISCQHFDEAAWDKHAYLSWNPELKKKIHQQWPHKQFLLSLFLLPYALIKCFCQAPKPTWSVLKNMGLKNFYLNAHFIESQADLIHFEFSATAIGKEKLKSALNCQMVLSFRGYDLEYSHFDQNHSLKYLWELGDHFHFLGQHLYKRAKQFGFPDNKTYSLIPPALEADSVLAKTKDPHLQIGTQERPLKLLSVGRLQWVKGYEYTVQMIHELCQRGIHVEATFMGDGPELESTLLAIDQMNLNDQIQIKGEQAHSSVYLAMAQADIFIHSAVSEGFCNAVIEAQAHGLPVVCSDAGGLIENIAPYQTGIIVERRNPLAMANAVQQLVEQPLMRHHFSLAGPMRVKAHFDLRNQSDAFVNLYDQCLETKTQCAS